MRVSSTFCKSIYTQSISASLRLSSARISFRSLPRETLGNLTRRGSPSRKELSTLGPERCTMALFVDRYRPKTLDDLDYHPELSSRLRALVSCSLPFALPLSLRLLS